MIVGKRVRWAHDREDGLGPAVQLEGTVAAMSRGGTPAFWCALVLKDDGTMASAAANDLQVVDRDNEDHEAGIDAVRALDYLEKFLEEQFPGTNAGGGPVEHAQSLLTELKSELIEASEMTSGLKVTNDSLTKELKALKKKAKPDPEPES